MNRLSRRAGGRFRAGHDRDALPEREPALALPKLDSLLVPFSTNWNTRTVASPATFGLLAPRVAAYTALHTPYITAAARR
jgi:hypothetical protein